MKVQEQEQEGFEKVRGLGGKGSRRYGAKEERALLT